MKGNISTRTGDKGTTGIAGGVRVSKSNIRIHCLGDLDEANSFLGLLRTKLPNDHDWHNPLRQIQTDMMNLMSHVATPTSSQKPPSVPLPEKASERMEDWMGEIEKSLDSVTEHFLLPGGTEISALCHVVRTIVRRAERNLAELNASDPIHPSILQFINRLSDLLFKLARQEIHRSGAVEERWHLFRSESHVDND
ncbi:MAG: cob(I)yrinic acid a,c-diamide adenosyltransferase [Verrucomicrobia bacterium]|nr:cob(I)yrinic acid a,c-diamide adenosyltransferase [Verrucomicrobiota bacterium]MDA1067660.1 cob(I)yrinic acid a,c-diamide adenosyltransferase [Verrucomicrobiota bacterium]